eukprot:365260-Amphidinium_carterae.1
MTDSTMLNKAWMVEKLSPDGRQAAETFLEILNGWCKENEDTRHLMFKNESGLVPTHLPWIIRDAVAWMKEHPCLSNIVPTIPEDTVDRYGRQLREGTINMKF